MQAKARKFVLRNAFQGVPKPEDFEIVEEDLPPLKDGGRPLRTAYAFVAQIKTK